LAVATVSIYSCKKEAVTSPDNGTGKPYGLSLVQTPSTSNERSLGGTPCLSFATIADYENSVSLQNTQAKTLFTNILNSFSTFTSYANAFPDDTLMDDPELASLLNKDGVIQIGGYYFRVDPVFEKVFVLPVTQSSYYSDLISTCPQSGKVTMFNTDDEVLELIKAGAMQYVVPTHVQVHPPTPDGSIVTRGLFDFFVNLLDQAKTILHIGCGDKGAKRMTAKSTDVYGIGYRLKSTLKYTLRGIHFTLYARVDNEVKNGVWHRQKAGLWINYDAGWKAICRDPDGSSDNCVVCVDGTSSSYTIDMYSRNRQLNTYEVEALAYNRTVGANSSTLYIHYP
jgi:hypothetical protein